jgi:hypothetical protein
LVVLDEGVGDTFGTCFGPLSRNRKFGYRLGQGEKIQDILASTTEVAEGYYTAQAVVKLIKAKYKGYRLDLKYPILFGIDRILDGTQTPLEGLEALMSMPMQMENFEEREHYHPGDSSKGEVVKKPEEKHIAFAPDWMDREVVTAELENKVADELEQLELYMTKLVEHPEETPEQDWMNREVDTAELEKAANELEQFELDQTLQHDEMTNHPNKLEMVELVEHPEVKPDQDWMDREVATAELGKKVADELEQLELDQASFNDETMEHYELDEATEWESG